MSIEAMKQALEALECGLEYAKGEQFENAQRFKGYEHLAPNDADSVKLIEDAITFLRQAIEQAEKQEPVAWMSNESAHRLKHGGNSKGAVPVHAKRSNTSKIPLYITPKREWVGLTDKDMAEITSLPIGTCEMMLKVEARLNEKNT